MIPTPASPQRNEPLKLILVDRLPAFRDSLRQAIYQGEGLRVIGEAGQAAAVFGGSLPLEADLALVDVDMEEGSSFGLCQWLKAHNPRLGVICLAYWDWDVYLAGAQAAGARGLLLRTAPTLELLQAIEKAAGGPIFSREQLLRIQKWNASFGSILYALRPREWQVFWLAADGLSNQTIATRLDVSENTVEKLITFILKQFNLGSRAQLLALIYKEHLEALRGDGSNRSLTRP